MTHLSDDQLVDAADGTLDAVHVAHLAECAGCSAQVRGIREALAAAREAPMPEPSPLFWEHFPRRIAAAIDPPRARGSWLSAGRLAWLGATAVLIVGLVGFEARRGGLERPAAEPAVTETAANPSRLSAPSAGELETDLPVEEDEAWAVVRSLADDLHYDDVQEAGILPVAGAVERAVTELPEAERAELVRLIRNELKRMGA